MATPLEQAYADYMVGEMIIDEVQKSVDGEIAGDGPVTLEIEDQGEAQREQAAWQAATHAAQNRKDLVLKAKILSRYAEDDPDSVVSALVASICADIDRLVGDTAATQPARAEAAARRDALIGMAGHGPLA